MELKERFFPSCRKAGYSLKRKDSLGEDGTVWTFLRRSEGFTEVLQVLYAEEFHRSHMENANAIFGEVYEKIVNGKKDANVRLTFLLCVDRQNLIYKWLTHQNTFQKKERILVPAGIGFSQRMLSAGNGFMLECKDRERKIMRDMKKELMGFLGLEDI